MTYGSHCSERLHDKCICDLNLEFVSVKVVCTGPLGKLDISKALLGIPYIGSAPVLIDKRLLRRNNCSYNQSAAV